MNSIDLKVTKTSVSITNQYTLNQGEYNVDKCVFDFTSDYDDLIKKAIFVYGEDITEMVILDNECNIPYELLQSSTEFTLKVYAYEVQDEELVQRYSPTPLKIFLREGSYQGSNEVITPTQFEQYEAKLDEGLQEVDAKLDEVDDKLEEVDTTINNKIAEVDEALDGVEEATTEANNLNIDVSDKVDGDVTITLTKKDASTKSVVLSDGTSLQFNWNGTQLGIKTTDEQEYTYVDLKGPQGDIGPQGEAFQIKKTYSTIQAMIDDYDNMEINDYVMISGNIEQEDNAKLFTKTETEDPTYRWQYLADFSGASGIQGPTGLTPNIQIGSVTGGSAPSVTRTGTNENPILNFVLQKGDKGDTGDTGPQGVGISSIVKTSTSGYVDTYTITYTDGTTSTFDVTNGEVSQAQLDEVIEELDNANQEIENLKTLRNILPKVSGTGESITLDNTGEVTLYNIDLYGNTSQDGEPTPDTPYPIHSVSGDNTINIVGRNHLPAPTSASETINGITLSTNGNGLYTASGKLTTASNTNKTFEIQPITLQAGTYYLHMRNTGTISTNVSIALRYGNSTIKYTTPSVANKIYEFTLTDNTIINGIQLFVASGFGTSDTLNIAFTPSIELTNEVTNYEPYSGDTYPINLPSGMEFNAIGDYKDTFIYTDKWYLEKVIQVIDKKEASYMNKISGGSDENYTQFNFQMVDNGYPIINSNLPNNASGKEALYCNMLKPNASAPNKPGISCICLYLTTRNLIVIVMPTSVAGTNTELNTYLSSNTMKIMYPINEELIPVTDETLISQLNAIKNAMSKQGQTNISQVNNDLPFELDVTALRDLSNIFEL